MTTNGTPVARVEGSTVYVCCDLDMATSMSVAAAIKGVSGDVTVDLADVEFIDSTGLRCLLVAQRDARRRGATLTFSNPNPNVTRLLDITGTGGQLGLAPRTKGVGT